MLAILWLISWATVGEAFYDDYDWYTSDDGAINKLESQRLMRENFNSSLRNFAQAYTPVERDADDEMTIAIAKSKLRLLKVFKHTGGSEDFEPNKGRPLPLAEGERFCTMGKYTRVDCNHCTCIAGQLYMCTGMICPKVPAKPQSMPSCKEGNRRKIDSCNYCYCLNGREICSTKDCRQRHVNLLIRTRSTRCIEAVHRVVDCNQCVCYGGREYCTRKICESNTELIMTPDNLGKRERPAKKEKTKECVNRDYKYEECNRCICLARQWMCTQKKCKGGGGKSNKKNSKKKKGNKNNHVEPHTTAATCKKGEIRKIDSCNFCACLNRQEVCTFRECLGKTDDKKLTKSPTPTFLRMPNNEDNFEVKPCTIGERYRVDVCNYCYCNEDGQRVCSNNKCELPQKVEPTYDMNATKARLCVVGTRFRKGICNYCYCNYNRQLICSNNKCTRSPSTRSSYLRTRYHCNSEEYEIYRLDHCNFCFCNAKRERVCTDYKCDSKSNVKKTTATMKPKSNYLSTNEKSCYEGSHRQIDECNYCVCLDGTEFCSEKYCSRESMSPVSFTEPQCKVGEPLPTPDSCNVCICLNSDRLCTNNPCNERQSASIGFSGSECEVGELLRAPDPCNVCICVNSKILCTNNICIESQSDIIRCPEGSRRQVDACNYCVCVSGVEFCTRKTCSRDTIASSSEPECIVGEPVPPPDSCNVCICLNWDILCTNYPCIERQSASLKRPLGRVENKNRNARQLLKQEGCVEYQPLHSDDACSSCICLHGGKVCAIIPCTDDTDFVNFSSDDILLNKIIGTKVNNRNMERKKQSFCVPFTFFSPDSNRFCRNCFCLHNGLAMCLLNLCKYTKDIANQEDPDDLDVEEVCTPGDIGYPTKCVTCTCSKHGKWICTREELALCQERDCDAKDEFHMGFFPYCAGCKCSVKEWYCSIQDEACRDYSNVTCPLGTFIHNPMQHCSICLCGGYEEGAHNMCFTEAKCVRQVIGY